MIRLGIVATARRKNGGTLLYTMSMLDALALLPASRYEIVLFVASGVREYDSYDFRRIPTPGIFGLIVRRLFGINPYDAADLVLAPVYSLSLAMCGKPFAFTLHDLQERHYPENFGLLTRLWRRVVNRILVSRSRRVICESQFVKGDIVRYIANVPDKIDVIPAPPSVMVCDAPEGGISIEEVLGKYSLSPGFVFYPAQFWPHKNHLRLVDAFASVLKRNPGRVLVFTGRLNSHADIVFRRVRELDIQSHVRHIGYVEQHELAALYKGAAVVVVPTLFESISIPVYEAFALGTPVCASNVVALPEQIGNAGLLFDPESPEDIAEKLCNILASPELGADLVEKGYVRIKSVTHAQYARSLEGLVNVMLSETTGR